MSVNALVLGVGGNISQGILKALNLSTQDIKIYSACIDPLSAGFYIGKHADTMISPRSDDVDFMDWLYETIEKYGIHIVYSGTEEVLNALSWRRLAIKEHTGAICVVSPYDVFYIGQDKLLTCKWLEENNLPFPPYVDMNNTERARRFAYTHPPPFILKPRVGRGSKGITKIESSLDIDYDDKLAVLQQCIGSDNEEYTVGCFCSEYGILKGIIIFKRVLKDGTTYVAEVGEFPEVRDAAKEIIQKLKPVGPCNIQMRIHEGVPTAFEFNIRYSSSTPMRARMGFNDVDAAIKHFVYGDNGNLGLVPAKTGYAIRYLNEVYVDKVGKRPGLVEDWGM